VSPEAAVGGPIALVRNGDRITIDAVKRSVTLHASAAELTRRARDWAPPRPYADRGVLAKYAREVSSASLGAVTDAPLPAPAVPQRNSARPSRSVPPSTKPKGRR
jgi:dihydroxy-acid dehydratase